MLFGVILKELREKYNMTHEELAEKTGFSKSIIWSYESAKKEPSISHLIRISEFFNVSIDYLIKGGIEKEKIDLDNSNVLASKDLVVDEISLSLQEIKEVLTYIKVKRKMHSEFL